MHCKGLCSKACGPIAMSGAESRRIIQLHGSMPESSPESLTCSKLVEGRCSIYADRPLLCRIFGASRGLRCPYGCTPDGPLVSDREARKLFVRADRLK